MELEVGVRYVVIEHGNNPFMADIGNDLTGRQFTVCDKNERVYRLKFHGIYYEGKVQDIDQSLLIGRVHFKAVPTYRYENAKPKRPRKKGIYEEI